MAFLYAWTLPFSPSKLRSSDLASHMSDVTMCTHQSPEIELLMEYFFFCYTQSHAKKETHVSPNIPIALHNLHTPFRGLCPPPKGSGGGVGITLPLTNSNANINLQWNTYGTEHTSGMLQYKYKCG